MWDKFVNGWGRLGKFLRRTALGIVIAFLGVIIVVEGPPHDRASALVLSSSILIFIGILLAITSQPSKVIPKDPLATLGLLMPGVVVFTIGIILLAIAQVGGNGPLTLTSEVWWGSILLIVFGAILFGTGTRDSPSIGHSTKRVPTANGVDEWKETRDLIVKFDDRRHEIRKYGVSFVAGLLTAQAIIGGSSAAITHGVKFAVLMATFVLIVAMRLTEEDYQHFIKAAVYRATELESSLGFQLTERIKEGYAGSKDILYLDAVYGFMTLAAGIFGYFLLAPNLVTNKAAIADVVATVLGVAIILYVGHVHYGNSD